MVTMSDVWDRAGEVLRGRAGVLAGIAVPALFLPGAARDAVALVATPGSAGFALAGGALAIVALLAAIWGQLALLAVAIDPRTTRGDASAQATARFPASLAVAVVVLVVMFAALIPFGVAIAASGTDLSRLGTTGAMPHIGGGTALFLGLYSLVLLIVGLWATARLILVNAVVLNERRGLGAFRRSWQLTAGLTLRILGVLLLYVVVLLVAVSAAQFITGAVFALLLGRGATVAFLAALASGAVTTVFSVIATAFTAQLYVAVTDRGVATVFE